MYGKDIGTLSVYKKTATGLDRVFVKTGEVGDFWERSVLDLSGESQPYQLVIEGVVGKSFLGDIGIDDTSFTDGCVLDKTGQIFTQATTTVTTQAPCGEPSQFQCLNKKCIGEDKVCNFVDECGDGSDEAECGTCDFESGMCGFYEKSEDMFRWNRTKAPSGISTGPKVDHTTNSISGHYLVTYEDLDLGGWLNHALLFGPRLQATGKAIILGQSKLSLARPTLTKTSPLRTFLDFILIGKMFLLYVLAIILFLLQSNFVNLENNMSGIRTKHIFVIPVLHPILGQLVENIPSLYISGHSPKK